MAFLFSIPIFYIAGMSDTRFVQERYFQFASMLLASLFFGNIWLTLFFWLNAVMYVVYGFSVGSSQVTNIFLTGLIFACSRNFFKTREVAPYFKALYLVLGLSLVYCVFQFFRIDPIGAPMSASGVPFFYGNTGQLNGLFFHTAIHSVFLAAMVPVLIFSGFWAGALLLPLIALLKCSGAILATGFTIPFIAYHKKKILFIPALALTVILGIGATYLDHKTDPKTYASRFESWHLVFRYCMINPLGWGPDSFRNTNKFKKFTFHSDENYYPLVMEKVSDDQSVIRYHSADPSKFKERYQGRVPKNLSVWVEVHNEFLQLFFEYGIFGVLLIFMFGKEFIDRFILSDKSDEVLALFGAILVIVIAGFTQFPFHLARISGIFGVLLGAYFAKTDKSYLMMRGEDDE